MKPRTGPVSESAKHQLRYLVQELKRPDESIAELYIRALENLKMPEVLSQQEYSRIIAKKIVEQESNSLNGWRDAIGKL